MKIYHYTSIETLALILKNKTIRFNRLDHVDDVDEAAYGSGVQKKVKISHYGICTQITKGLELVWMRICLLPMLLIINSNPLSVP